MGILALSGGKSVLAAVVWAATESVGLQSILSDFGLFGVMWQSKPMQLLRSGWSIDSE